MLATAWHWVGDMTGGRPSTVLPKFAVSVPNTRFAMLLLFAGWLLRDSSACLYMFLVLVCVLVFSEHAATEPATALDVVGGSRSRRSGAQGHRRRVSRGRRLMNTPGGGGGGASGGATTASGDGHRGDANNGGQPPERNISFADTSEAPFRILNGDDTGTSDGSTDIDGPPREGQLPRSEQEQQRLEQMAMQRSIPGCDTDVTYNLWGRVFYKNEDVTAFLKIPPAAPQRCMPRGCVDADHHNHVFYAEIDGDIVHLCVTCCALAVRSACDGQDRVPAVRAGL